MSFLKLAINKKNKVNFFFFNNLAKKGACGKGEVKWTLPFGGVWSFGKYQKTKGQSHPKASLKKFLSLNCVKRIQKTKEKGFLCLYNRSYHASHTWLKMAKAKKNTKKLTTRACFYGLGAIYTKWFKEKINKSKLSYAPLKTSSVAGLFFNVFFFILKKKKPIVNGFRWRKNIPLREPRNRPVAKNPIFKIKKKLSAFMLRMIGPHWSHWFSITKVINYQRDQWESFFKAKAKFIAKEYSLETFHRSNQDTCLFHNPAVFEGDWIQAGDLLADCAASSGGELSLGKNILVAYMPWEGYNFEDAILISERLVYDDVYSSIHIERYDIEIRETKFGMETITRNIPDLNKNAKDSGVNLDSNGIAKLGSWIKEGDILVGRITPINKKAQSTYQNLLYTILDKSFDSVRDSSLRAPKGIKAKVINIQIKRVASKQRSWFNKAIKNQKSGANSAYKPLSLNTKWFKKGIDAKQRDKKKIYFDSYSYLNRFFFKQGPQKRGVLLLKKLLRAKTNFIAFAFRGLKFFSKKKISSKDSASSNNKGPSELPSEFNRKPRGSSLCKGPRSGPWFLAATRCNPSEGSRSQMCNPSEGHRKPFTIKKNFNLNKINKTNKNSYLSLKTALAIGVKNFICFKLRLKSTWLEGHKAAYTKQNHKIISKAKKKQPSDRAIRSFQTENKINQVYIYLAEKRKIQVGDKMAGRHGNKGIVSLILPRQDMPFLANGTPIDMVLNPLGVPSRMNVGQIYECLLGLAAKYLGEHYKIFPFDEIYGPEASRSFVYSKLYEASIKTKNDWLFDPNSPGKTRLFDGRSGEPFDQSVTVGYAYMLKLVHLVDDKIHMRSTGPYSLVTQQPLRGRSKQGGQRLGEMEVWALEGYGAAFTLLEMLTIKSDDMTGRMTLWSNLILNKDISIGTPESFKVLVCELQALCLDIGLFRIDSSYKLSEIESLTQLP